MLYKFGRALLVYTMLNSTVAPATIVSVNEDDMNLCAIDDENMSFFVSEGCIYCTTLSCICTIIPPLHTFLSRPIRILLLHDVREAALQLRSSFIHLSLR